MEEKLTPETAGRLKVPSWCECNLTKFECAGNHGGFKPCYSKPTKRYKTDSFDLLLCTPCFGRRVELSGPSN